MLSIFSVKILLWRVGVKQKSHVEICTKFQPLVTTVARPGELHLGNKFLNCNFSKICPPECNGIFLHCEGNIQQPASSQSSTLALHVQFYSLAIFTCLICESSWQFLLMNICPGALNSMGNRIAWGTEGVAVASVDLQSQSASSKPLGRK